MATIESLLRDRVLLRVRSVDRIFLAGYVPRLQSEGQVVRFLLDRGVSDPVAGGAGEDQPVLCAGDRAVRGQARGSRRAFQEGRGQGANRAAVHAQG